MSMEELSTAAAKVVGIKQTTRAVLKGLVREVFVAADADARLTKPVVDLCKSQGVTCTQVPVMQELGKACGIHAGAAAAAILKS
jgi:large subunit ribosomal protein L7A